MGPSGALSSARPAPPPPPLPATPRLPLHPARRAPHLRRVVPNVSAEGLVVDHARVDREEEDKGGKGERVVQRVDGGEGREGARDVGELQKDEAPCVGVRVCVWVSVGVGGRRMCVCLQEGGSLSPRMCRLGTRAAQRPAGAAHHTAACPAAAAGRAAVRQGAGRGRRKGGGIDRDRAEGTERGGVIIAAGARRGVLRHAAARCCLRAVQTRAARGDPLHGALKLNSQTPRCARRLAGHAC